MTPTTVPAAAQQHRARKVPPRASPPVPPPLPSTKSTPRSAIDEWQRRVGEMSSKTKEVDWSKTDFSKLQPSDIGVQMGPAMTEEEFRDYRRRTGGGARVIGSASVGSAPGAGNGGGGGGGGP